MLLGFPEHAQPVILEILSGRDTTIISDTIAEEVMLIFLMMRHANIGQKTLIKNVGYIQAHQDKCGGLILR